MPSQMVWPLIFALLMLSTVLVNPLTSMGDRIGPGWSDVLNGSLGLLFLILAGVSGFIASRRAKRSRGQ
jgi:hypothetical protein